jgi:hypothetical protein
VYPHLILTFPIIDPIIAYSDTSVLRDGRFSTVIWSRKIPNVQDTKRSPSR